MKIKRIRHQQTGDFHFLTFSCYRHRPYLAPVAAMALFENALELVRLRYYFAVAGYVVMPEHVHRLVSEPSRALLSRAIQALKLSICTAFSPAFLGVVLLGAIIGCPSSMAAQIPLAEVNAPTLDVVSVRPIKGDLFSGCPPCGTDLTPDGLRVNWPALDGVIRIAFGGVFFKGSQVIGMPSWASNERYFIWGKVKDADLEKMEDLSRRSKQVQGPILRSMLQAVLTDRFQLRAHIEMREGPIYKLVIAKNGSKLKAATPCDAYDEASKHANNLPTCRSWGDPLGGKIDAQSESLHFLVNLLTKSASDRVVVDMTGLTGKYDYTLTWTPDQTSPSSTLDNGEVTGPSLFTALQEQLGLKLVPAKGPVRVLVIDHLERPSPN